MYLLYTLYILFIKIHKKYLSFTFQIINNISKKIIKFIEKRQEISSVSKTWDEKWHLNENTSIWFKNKSIKGSWISTNVIKKERDCD